jgi:glyoxylase-like metal-dependent hydrolase (beta-lactamase superfamily II)
MSGTVHRFRVGTVECAAILDGIGQYPPAMFFLNLPKERYEPALRQRSGTADVIDIAINCLLLRTGRERILVDTGARGLLPDAGQLLAGLAAEGVAPRDIDVVVLSHAHGDHIAGNLNEAGAPAFSNARYVMLETEWNYWMSKPSLDQFPLDDATKARMLAFIETNLHGIQGQLELVQPEAEISQDILLREAFGHTPGHAMLEVATAGERLMFIGDALIDPLNVEYPETRAAVDHVPDLMVRTRRRILEAAGRAPVLVAAAHFPFPGLGRIVEHGDGFRWQPV